VTDHDIWPTALNERLEFIEIQVNRRLDAFARVQAIQQREVTLSNRAFKARVKNELRAEPGVLVEAGEGWEQPRTVSFLRLLAGNRDGTTFKPSTCSLIVGGLAEETNPNITRR
jgi:hypothetical protein